MPKQHNAKLASEEKLPSCNKADNTLANLVSKKMKT